MDDQGVATGGPVKGVPQLPGMDLDRASGPARPPVRGACRRGHENGQPDEGSDREASSHAGTLGAVGLRIETVTEQQFEALLPMIADYQRFYGRRGIDEGRNREFFRRFITPSDDGMLIAAWRDGEPVGYACLYWHFTSLGAAEVVLMNDLFVAESARRNGIGRALIDASVDVARARGAAHLEWATRPDNEAGRRLYDATGAEPSTWIAYELDIGQL